MFGLQGVIGPTDIWLLGIGIKGIFFGSSTMWVA